MISTIVIQESDDNISSVSIDPVESGDVVLLGS
jgi:hypothetical protein